MDVVSIWLSTLSLVLSGVALGMGWRSDNTARKMINVFRTESERQASQIGALNGHIDGFLEQGKAQLEHNKALADYLGEIALNLSRRN